MNYVLQIAVVFQDISHKHIQQDSPIPMVQQDTGARNSSDPCNIHTTTHLVVPRNLIKRSMAMS